MPRKLRIPFRRHWTAFPGVADLPNLAPEDAQRALDALRRLARAELLDVYSSAGSNDTRWNVWSNIQWRRVPLQEWAAQWLADEGADESKDKGNTPPTGGVA